MIIDLSLWTCQITGLRARRMREETPRYTLAGECGAVISMPRTCTRTRSKRGSSGNGSVRINARVCFAPKCIAPTRKRRRFIRAFVLCERRLIPCSCDYAKITPRHKLEKPKRFQAVHILYIDYSSLFCT